MNSPFNRCFPASHVWIENVQNAAIKACFVCNGTFFGEQKSQCVAFESPPTTVVAPPTQYTKQILFNFLDCKNRFKKSKITILAFVSRPHHPQHNTWYSRGEGKRGYRLPPTSRKLTLIFAFNLQIQNILNNAKNIQDEMGGEFRVTNRKLTLLAVCFQLSILF